METKMKMWQVVQHVIDEKPTYTLSLVESDGKTLVFLLSISFELFDGKYQATKTDESGVEVYTEFPVEDLGNFILQTSSDNSCVVSYVKTLKSELEQVDE